jgi:tetratricopeptide (TPR) repeat protein
MQRTDLIQLIEASLASGQAEYARQVAARHLADWPGDLGVQHALARALAAQDRHAAATEVLERLVAVDPEDSAAQRTLGQIYQAHGREADALNALANAHVMDGQGAGAAVPEWANRARAAQLAERIGDWGSAQREALAATRAEPGSLLAALRYLAALWHTGQLDLAGHLSDGLLKLWPQLAAPKLCLAESLMAQGAQPRAIELLHAAAAHDAGGQVVTRHWGSNHPYRALWDMNPSAGLPGPLPGELVHMLGLNQLRGAGEAANASTASHTAQAKTSEEVAEIQAKLDEIAARLPNSSQTVKQRLLRLTRAERPRAKAAATAQATYVVISSRTRLNQTYGQPGFAKIDAALRTLVATAAKRASLKPCLLYVDDPAALSPYGVRPANPVNAWEIKTLIGKLAARLKTLDSSIGALLIVGGSEIIPFHHLPNPTDDADPDIPSDNPYATADDNYFVPEWPIGRLPTPAGNDPAPLLRALQHMGGVAAAAGKTPAYQPWADWLREWLQQLWSRYAVAASFGYSANVWRGASAAVYNLIGDPRELLTCPPLDADALPIEGLAPSRLSYFNLHGVEDGPEWYGQRSATDPSSLPEYPVALRPGDVTNSGRAPSFVFSEACYGANILNKQTEDALCLKFLDAGTRAMVASTKIAYGSVATPLIGADLLGKCFWQNINQGLPAGEALQRAKLQLAQEMQQRQGFLDGEDQKTLIEFVLYGDPLAMAPAAPKDAQRAAKPLPVLRAGAPLVTVCEKAGSHGSHAAHDPELSPETIMEIKGAVARYLPGMLDAHATVTHSHSDCTGAGHACPTAQLSKQRKGRAPAEATTVVTLSKTTRSTARLHPHYARVTLNAQGAIIKMALSR